jgi:hypothetical protein
MDSKYRNRTCFKEWKRIIAAEKEAKRQEELRIAAVGSP